MASEAKKCSECGGEMEEGFILDKGYGEIRTSRWLKGHPEASFWQGTKTKGKECRVVESYRCVKCGFLKSYATTLTDPPNSFTG
jgi:predicted RNA-binding Zn-ribbon protein involved in translation (DUF1610 family)